MNNNHFPKQQFAHDKLLRLKEVLDLVPVGRSTWWQKVREGVYPAPVYLGPRTTAWRESEVLQLINNGIDQDS